MAAPGSRLVNNHLMHPSLNKISGIFFHIDLLFKEGVGAKWNQNPNSFWSTFLKLVMWAAFFK